MKQDHIDEIRHGESDMNYQTIYLAGGCFWGTEKFFRQFDGIIETEVGYANGPAQEASAPTYEEVCMSSGHAETVRIVYDPAVIPLRKLLDYYFMAIDPVSVNRQGNDVGIQYRTGIYYTDKDQKQIAEEKLSEISKELGCPSAVELLPISNFYPAEEYHQRYLDKNPGGYCHIPARLLNLS